MDIASLLTDRHGLCPIKRCYKIVAKYYRREGEEAKEKAKFAKRYLR